MDDAFSLQQSYAKLMRLMFGGRLQQRLGLRRTVLWQQEPARRA